ncbi:MAG: FG-GAP-like repeat-containing protein [Planctomycetota bacterium]|jgi:hypothetical protein
MSLLRLTARWPWNPGLPVAAGLVVGLALPGGPVSGQTQFDFAFPVVYPIGFEAYPHSVDAGDLNEDGFVDLVLAARNNEGRAIIMWGQANGTFGPPVDLDVGDQTNWAVIRDLNGDGDLDLAISHRSGLGRVSVMLGHGDGTFDPPVDTLAGRYPTLILAGDFDGDEDLDLVTFNWGSYDVSVLQNGGDGSFGVAHTVPMNQTMSPAAFPVWAASGDLDGDSDLDLVVGSIYGDDYVSIFFNNGDATFANPRQRVVADGGVLGAVTTADFDGDGDVDVAVKGGGFTSEASFLVLVNDGDGRFPDIVEVPLAVNLGGSPWDIASADFDNDGHADLASVSHFLSSQNLALVRNVGTGGPDFTLPEQVFPLGGFPRVILPTDVDGDLDLDIIVVNIASHAVAVLENQTSPGAAAASGASPRPLLAPDNGDSGVGPPPGAARAATGRDGGKRPDGRPDNLMHVLGGIGDAIVPSVPPPAGGPAAGPFEVCGDPEAGDCFEANGTPGCDDEACCIVTCEEDPFCCDVEWDQDCADTAFALCEDPPPCPGEGSCFEPHPTPGCDDEDCCNLICLIDGYCCGVWDQICAAEAARFCGAPMCELPSCPDGATPEPEGIQCLERVNDGCNLTVPLFTPISCGETVCGTTWTRQLRDTDWYEIIVDEPTELTWTVTSEFPSEVLIVSGTCDTTYTVEAAAFGGECQPASVALAVGAGSYYLFVAPGSESLPIHHGIGCIDDEGEFIEGGAFNNKYFATVDCEPLAPSCPADLDGDGFVGIRDLLVLLAAWGTDPGGPPDLDGDGFVGIRDLITLLSEWGPCP